MATDFNSNSELEELIRPASTDQNISRSLRTLIRGLTQDNVTEMYEGYKALFQLGPAVVPQVRAAIAQSKWSKVKHPNEIRYITGLVNLVHDIDEAEAEKISRELRANGCDPAVAKILDSIGSFRRDDYVQYSVCGVKVFEHKQLITTQNVKRKLEQWLKHVPAEDLDEIERIYILKAADLKALGTYKPILYRINLAWDNSSPQWSPMSWINNFIIESTLYHEIGHHVSRHTFGQDPDQEEEAQDYADRMMAYRSSHLLFRVGRFLKNLPPEGKNRVPMN